MKKIRNAIIKYLLNGDALIANVNIQFMEAETANGKCATIINCTRGTVDGMTGAIAFGSFALANAPYTTNGKISKRPIGSQFTYGELERLKPSAYELSEEMKAQLRNIR